MHAFITHYRFACTDSACILYMLYWTLGASVVDTCYGSSIAIVTE